MLKKTVLVNKPIHITALERLQGEVRVLLEWGATYLEDLIKLVSSIDE